MKYYVYISDTKLEMLYAQIPVQTRDRIATELKIDLKVIAATFSEKPPDATRLSKLKLVTSYINTHEKVGTVDKPENFFGETMLLRWGPYQKSSTSVYSNLVYFGGLTAHTVLGLGGSRRHVIGEMGGSEIHASLSTAPQLISFLSQELKLPSSEPERPKRINEDSLLAVETATEYMKGPIQKFEFLAKRLLEGPPHRAGPSHLKRVLLGSPIYVALAE